VDPSRGSGGRNNAMTILAQEGIETLIRRFIPTVRVEGENDITPRIEALGITRSHFSILISINGKDPIFQTPFLISSRE
jgi:hypothetical protein